MGNVRKTLRVGHSIAKRMVKNQLYTGVFEYAKGAILDAAFAWVKDAKARNLTGNTLAGFSAGIYVDNKWVKSVNILEISGFDEPTHGYSFMGDSGFTDYDSGEDIEAVKDYNPQKSNGVWHETNLGGSAIVDTLNWLKNSGSKYLSRKSDVAVIVANVSPYVEYIHEERNLDILDTVNLEKETKFKAYILKQKLQEVGIFDNYS